MEVVPLWMRGSVGTSSPPWCAVADLYAHLSLLWVSGHGWQDSLCVLVCVTLTLGLHISVSHSPSLDLCPGLLSLGGSVKVQVYLCIEGTATLPWTALTLDLGETQASTSQLPDGSKPS